ncbi:MAG TPA: substrate-binding domain-containing protein, partial [Bryobacteraceae bacterium]|nr:substrate-binding domain-containing protein [Bryobacteraceae bacterium]
ELSGGDAKSAEKGREAMRQLLKLDPRPDGVFCFNDPTALGALNAIFTSGLRIPQEIAVIGCGNIHYDDVLAVPLSSIDQQSTLIGERAAKLALSLIQAKTQRRPADILLEPRVVVRASTQRSPAGASA